MSDGSPHSQGPHRRAQAVTPEQAGVIRGHLAYILESRAFRGSDRSKHFLQYVVEQALEGRQEDLKERVIGAQVFGRAAGYETATDAIVRVKANEVRKRLAQFYGESAGNGLQIELPAGSYVPEFHWLPAAPAESPVSVPGAVLPRRLIARRTLAWLGGSSAVLGLAAAGWLAWQRASTTALDEFWAPVVDAAAAPVICITASETCMLWNEPWARLQRVPPDNPEPMPIRRDQIALLSNLHVTLPTLHAVVGLSTWLEQKGKVPQYRPNAELTLEDLRDHAVISVGGFLNPWTLGKTSDLRFAFHRERDFVAVRDQLQPGREWRVAPVFPWGRQSVDYAIVSRVFDGLTGNTFIALAGITAFGSQAAGEFLTNPRYWKQFAHSAPAGWQKKNFQVVLETALVANTPNLPKVVATHFW